MVEVLGVLAALMVCVALMWLATRIDPHWSSRDGERFTCVGQQRSAHGDPLGRWRELRVALGDDRDVSVAPRSPLRMSPTTVSLWRLAARSDEAPRGKVLYVLEGNVEQAGQLVLRLPERSRSSAVLDRRLGVTRDPQRSGDESDGARARGE